LQIAAFPGTLFSAPKSCSFRVKMQLRHLFVAANYLFW
jgi:hypothetical protein